MDGLYKRVDFAWKSDRFLRTQKFGDIKDVGPGESIVGPSEKQTTPEVDHASENTEVDS